MSRTLVFDCKYLATATPGDGVAGTELTQHATIHEDSIAFNFSEQKEVSFTAMGTDEPWAVIYRKEDPSSIEFAIPSPTADECVAFMGGTKENEKWTAPTTTPVIRKTLVIKSADYDGKYAEYTFPLVTVSARLSQAPGKEETELMLVKATITTPVSNAGVVGAPYTREIKSVS